MTWTLILLFTVQLGPVFAPSEATATSAPGFTSEKACRAAQLDAVLLAKNANVKLTAICVPTEVKP